MSERRSVFPGFRELDDPATRVGWSLAAHRRRLGLSQQEVARRMGTSQPAVARLESGSTNARLSTLTRYADALGCSLEIELRQG